MKYKMTSFYVTPEMHAKLKLISLIENKTISALLRELAEELVKKDKYKEKLKAMSQ